MSEEFPTFNAFIRPLTSVNPIMFNKVCILAEGFPTLATFKELLTSVSSVMFSKI